MTTSTTASRRVGRAGDWIEVNGLPGRGPRCGQILQVLGEEGHEHYHVRWDERHESLFYPTEGATIIRPLRPRGARR